MQRLFRRPEIIQLCLAIAKCGPGKPVVGIFTRDLLEHRNCIVTLSRFSQLKGFLYVGSCQIQSYGLIMWGYLMSHRKDCQIIFPCSL